MATKKTPKPLTAARGIEILCAFSEELDKRVITARADQNEENARLESLIIAQGENLVPVKAQVEAVYEDVNTHRQELLLLGDELKVLTKQQDGIARRQNDLEVETNGLHSSAALQEKTLLSATRWNLAINIGVSVAVGVVTYWLVQVTR